MSSKLLPLILLASIPSASENLAAGYHVGQQWMNTATGIMYQCTGDGSWKQQYGTNDSPVFSKVTVNASGVALELIGGVGNPCYIRTDQTANGGKKWRFGNTGAVSYSSFDIWNETDGITALSIAETGVATFSGAVISASTVSGIGYFGETSGANPKQVFLGYGVGSATTYGIQAYQAGIGYTTLTIQPYGNSVVIGTDPGGSDILRVGGAATFIGSITCQGGLIRQNGGDGEVWSISAGDAYGAYLKVLTGKEDYNGILSVVPGGSIRWQIGRFSETSGIAFYNGGARNLWITPTVPTEPNTGEVRIGGGQFHSPTGQGLYIGGTARFTGDSDYSSVRSPSGASKQYIGNSDSYYDNVTHNFRNSAGTAAYLTLGSGSATFSSYVIVDTALVINSSTSPYIEFQNAGTQKAYIQWNNGNLQQDYYSSTSHRFLGDLLTTGQLSAINAGTSIILTLDGIAAGATGGSSIYFKAGGSLLGAHGVKSSISGGGYSANIWTYFANEYHIGSDYANPVIRVLNSANNHQVIFKSNATPGVANANEVLIGGGQVSSDKPYVVRGYNQPPAMTSFVNITASTYAVFLTLTANDMYQVTVGNATDGYMATAIVGKPSSGSAVLLSETHSNANLTITLSGDDVRVNNGIGNTRTIIYCMTKIYSAVW